jgi:hypothetical protein
MTNMLHGIDNWTAFVALIVKHVSPTTTVMDVYDHLGIGALYVMSEEWWDASVIDMSPRMQVGAIPALIDIRQQQIRRMKALGVDVHLTWHHANDQQLGQLIAHAISAGHTVGLYGVTAAMAVHVSKIDSEILTCTDTSGKYVVLDLNQIRAPAGVLCVIASPTRITPCDPVEMLHWLVYLLNGLPTIAFDTPRHPLRDWQVWHIGVDAFAVGAFSAETAAPLAIVSDNVSRIIHAYIWRINLLQQQLMRIDQAVNALAIRDAIDAGADVRFFMDFVARQYPQNCARRALTQAEGALIAETCRDTRQVLRSIVDLLSRVE